MKRILKKAAAGLCAAATLLGSTLPAVPELHGVFVPAVTASAAGSTAVLSGDTLTLSGNVVKEDVRAFAENEAVKKVVCAAGTVFPADCSFLFYRFKYAESMDLSKVSTVNVTNMNDMFDECLALRSLDLSSFDTSKTKKMSAMFMHSGLTELDLSHFDTSSVTSMDDMFFDCFNLESVDLSSFDTSDVTKMNGMFYDCDALTELNLSSFDTSKVTDTICMFEGCTALTAILVGSKWSTAKVNSSSGMFNRCTALSGGAGTVYDPEHTDAAYAHIDGGQNDPGYLTNAAATVRLSGDTLILSGNVVKEEVQAYAENEAVKKVVCKPGTVFPADSGKLFYNFNAESFDLSEADTSNVRDMNTMFGWCCNVTALDLSSFDTSNVTNMADMFCWTRKLTSLNISSFDTSKTEYMCRMFAQSALTELDLSHFDTSSVKTIYGMFWDCFNLESMDLSSFDTSNVTDMGGLFRYCDKLTVVDLSSFDTSKVTNMGCMFDRCYALTTIYAGSGWSTASLLDSYYMFCECNALVGGAGTCYDEAHTDGTYARIDCAGTPGDAAAAVPGYFTAVLYPLYINQEQVSGLNAADILGDGTASYNAAARTLILNGLNLNLAEMQTSGIMSSIDGLTIRVTGDSSLAAKYNAICLSADTTITGSGKLTVSSADFACFYLSDGMNLTIRNADLLLSSNTGISGGRGGPLRQGAKSLIIDSSAIQTECTYAAIDGLGEGITLKNCRFADPQNAEVTENSRMIGSRIVTTYSVTADGEIVKNLTVEPVRTLTSSMVTLSKTSFPYTGSAVKVGSYLTVKYNGETLVYGEDFTTSYQNNVNVGVETAKVIIKGIGRFKGSVTKKYTITPKKQAKPTLSMNGTALHVVWKADSTAEGYQVQYCKKSSFTGDTLHTANYGKSVTSCNLSTYPKLGETWYVRVRAYITNGSGTKYGTWSDAASKKLTAAISSVTLSKTQFAYTGSAVKVGSYLTVKCGDTKLTYGTDYTTSYSANTAVGYQTATVTVKGTGKYSGTFTKKYTIYPKKQNKPTLSMDGTVLHVAWTADSSAVGYELEYCQNSSFSTTDASYHTVTYTGKNAVNLSKYPKLGETWYVRVRAFITNNGSTSGTKYGEWSAAASKKLTAAITSVTLSKTEFNYTGSAITVGSYLTVKCGDTKLTYGTDYTTTYTANKNCGVETASVTVKGIGKYSGTFTKKFTIVPAKQAKPALTAVSGGFKAAWTADSNAIGYELVYCKNSSFTGETLHSYVYTATSATLTKYPATGEKWYVKVRAVISSNGTTSGTLYGTYSAVASVTAG